MASPTYDLDERFDAVPGSVVRARNLVTRFAAGAGAGERLLEDIRLAVSEAVTNAVIHGYRGTPGVIRVTASVDSDGTLDVAVRDAGCGPDPEPRRPGLGLGLRLIEESTDEMAMLPYARGIEVQMRFALARTPMFV